MKGGAGWGIISRTKPHSAKDLSRIVASFGGQRIMLLGDVMVDEYFYGDADRVSPEAPVPVVQERSRKHRARRRRQRGSGAWRRRGDCAYVAVCTRTCRGGCCSSFFRVWDSGGGRVDTAGILRCKDRPTTSKIRIVGLAQHRHPQQMLRLDQETTTPLSAEQEDHLIAYIRRELPACAGRGAGRLQQRTPHAAAVPGGNCHRAAEP